MGSLYRPTLKSGAPGRILWAKYYVNGRPVRESTGCALEKDARDFLRRREGAVAQGAPILPRADRIRYDELAEDLRRHYATTGSRNLREVDKRLKHLDRFWRGARAVTITPARATQYVEMRQREGVANATINRELAVLVTLLRRGYTNGKVLRVPTIGMLTEAPPRAGFFEDDQYMSVRRHLPEDLQIAAAIAHTYGWRTQSEILTRQWQHVDLAAGTLRLDPGEAKNKDGRLVYLTPELQSLLEAQQAHVEALQRRLGRIVPWVFPHWTGGPRYQAGSQRKDYRRTWEAACRAAGVAGRLRHDFRRTAVRNMERRGVARSVATKLTGHKTEKVYTRYAIVSDADLREATRKLTTMLPRRSVDHEAV
jgi:integrase